MRGAYLVGGLLCLLCVAVGVYYLLPGFSHLLVFDHPTDRHVKHALAFFALGLLALLGARFAANAEAAR